MRFTLMAGALACGLVVPLSIGCTSHTVGKSLAPEEVTPEAEAILHVGQAYREAYAARKKKPPTGINDLKPYLAKFGDPDKALISPSDGQPFEITWGIVPGRPPRNMKVNPFLVCEKSGKDGKRYVLDFTFRVRCLTEKEIETLRGPAQ